MNAVVVYESVFGATRQIAQAIAEGLTVSVPTELVNVHDVTGSTLQGVDLLVVGAPNHGRRLPTPVSRAEAQKWPADPHRHVTLEPGSLESGMREWLEELMGVPTRGAAFATRADINRFLSGSVAARLGRELESLGATLLLPAEDFDVELAGPLVDGEVDRARAWGRALGTAALQSPAAPTP